MTVGQPAPTLLNLGRANVVMRQLELDAIVAATPENVTYLSDFWSMSQWLRRSVQVYGLLPCDRPSDAGLVIPSGNIDLLTTEPSWISDVRRYGFFAFEFDPTAPSLDGGYLPFTKALKNDADADASSALVRLLQDKGLAESRLGVDEMGMSPNVLSSVRSALPKARFVNASSAFGRIRAVKTPEEIERLKQAAQITETAIEESLRMLREGMTERELADVFHASLVRQGARPANSVICFGDRAALPNGQPTDRALRAGEVVRYDVGCTFRHYRADIARCAVLGRPPARLRDAYASVLAGERAAIDAVRTGARACDVFATAMNAARAVALPNYRRAHVGHGIGIEGYDVPHLAPDDETVIEQGMVMCVETPYYELGWGGVQVEDTIAVGAHGATTLMATSQELRIIA